MATGDARGDTDVPRTAATRRTGAVFVPAQYTHSQRHPEPGRIRQSPEAVRTDRFGLPSIGRCLHFPFLDPVESVRGNEAGEYVGVGQLPRRIRAGIAGNGA